MSSPATQTQIDAASVYERLFVPAEFQEWAPRLIAAAQIQPGDKVLDVACGTGVLARPAALRVGPAGFVAGLDLDPGMLAVAAPIAPEIEWREGTAESLSYPAGFFDAVVCQFGLMFFNDRRLALREMLRVLAPARRIAVSVWDRLEHTPAYSTLVALLERIAGQHAAEVLRAPFALGDLNELATLFAGAGMPSVTITTHVGTAQFPSIRSMVEAEVRGWFRVAGVILADEQIHQILAEAEHALSPYVTSEGRVKFDSPAHIITSTKP